MTRKRRTGSGIGLGSIGRVFRFFLFLGRRAKRAKAFLVLSVLPVLLAGLIKNRFVFRAPGSVEVRSAFLDILMVFYIQFLVIILGLFYGSSVCSEEVEGRTLSYLTSRPVSKSGIILGKYAAYTVMMIVMVVTSVFFSYFILNLNRLSNPSLYPEFLRYAGVLSLGIACYTAFFTLLGTFFKKAILIGLVFGFGWENVIQYFPGSTQRFSVVHYLKSLLPGYSRGKFSVLLWRLEPTEPAVAILVLVLMTAVFLTAACLVFRWKEYISEE